MLECILVYTGQQKFDENANEMVTYRALKGEEKIFYCNYACNEKQSFIIKFVRD